MLGIDGPPSSRRPVNRPRRGAATILLWACAAFLIGPSGAARAQTPAEGTTTMVARIVAGILSYTRWPTPLASIRLCTLGRGAGVDALLRVADFGSLERRVSVAAVASLGAAAQACDALYVGHAPDAEARAAVRLFAGRPVLVVGEGHEFCSEGGMFCVDPGAELPRFGVNLDAVARSGLRVNPQVLRIARGGEGRS